MRAGRDLEKVACSTIERHRMLEGGGRVVVSVSGGPDSTALLLFLHSIAGRLGLDLHVFHLDHMIRGEQSARDAVFVRELAGSLGLPCRSYEVDVRREAEAGRSPQDAARRVRLGLAEEYATELGASRVATGHSADDQVETFLMRIVQGAGLSGLGGIPAVRGRFVRPLIEVWRDEIEEYLERKGAAARLDPSNLDESYLRNRVRARVLPFLAAEFGAGIKEVLLREVESLAHDRSFISERALSAFEELAEVEGGEVRLSIDGLLALPEALRRAIAREAWARAMPGEPPIRHAHVLDLLEKVAAGRTGAAIHLPGPLVAEREYGELVLRRPAGGGEPPGEAPLYPGEEVALPWAGVVIRAVPVPLDRVRMSADPSVEFARPDTPTPLSVRPPAPGDRFVPLGAPGSRKLKDFFIDAKLPRPLRARCPVVLSGDDIVWVAGHRLDDRFRLRESDTRALMLIMEPMD